MPRRRFNSKERLFIEKRALGLCEYCLSPQNFSPEIFSLEHIKPVALGGSNEMDNMALACGGCNKFKRDYVEWIDPETGLTSPLFNPRTDLWKSHFAWSADFIKVAGLTPVGRATIDLLQLNRNGIVNLRSALHIYGVHPPK